jgi:hypothetical protein
MKKSTIVRTWLGGLVALAAGLLVAAVSIGLMLAYGGTFTQASSTGGYDFVPTLDGFFWMTVGGIVTGCAFAAAGGLIQLVAWIGALINTSECRTRPGSPSCWPVESSGSLLASWGLQRWSPI